MEQLQSHRLFVWAFQTIAGVVDALIRDHGLPSYVAEGLRTSYRVEGD
jgi:hypothetical protein